MAYTFGNKCNKNCCKWTIVLKMWSHDFSEHSVHLLEPYSLSSVHMHCHIVYSTLLLRCNALYKRVLWCCKMCVCPSVTQQMSRKVIAKTVHIFSKVIIVWLAPNCTFSPMNIGAMLWRKTHERRCTCGVGYKKGVECKGGTKKLRFFSQISRCISQTVIVRWAHAATQFVSIEFSFHPYSI